MMRMNSSQALSVNWGSLIRKSGRKLPPGSSAYHLHKLFTSQFLRVNSKQPQWPGHDSRHASQTTYNFSPTLIMPTVRASQDETPKGTCWGDVKREQIPPSMRTHRMPLAGAAHETEWGIKMCYSRDSLQKQCTRCDIENWGQFVAASWHTNFTPAKYTSIFAR